MFTNDGGLVAIHWACYAHAPIALIQHILSTATLYPLPVLACVDTEGCTPLHYFAASHAARHSDTIAKANLLVTTHKHALLMTTCRV